MICSQADGIRISPMGLSSTLPAGVFGQCVDWMGTVYLPMA